MCTIAIYALPHIWNVTSQETWNDDSVKENTQKATVQEKAAHALIFDSRELERPQCIGLRCLEPSAPWIRVLIYVIVPHYRLIVFGSQSHTRDLPEPV